MPAPDQPPSAPPPPPPSPATWMPPSAPYAGTPPGAPLSQRLSSENLAQRFPWAFLAMGAYAIGLLLLFVGGLVAVTAGVWPPSCLNSTSCGTGATLENVYYGIMVARLLLVLGLFGIATGAGLHLQFAHEPASGLTPETTRLYISRRRFERVLLVFTVLLLFVIVYWAAVTPT